MTTERTKISYGLRGADGRHIHITEVPNHNADSCGEYRYTLKAGREPYTESKQFKVDSIHELLGAIRFNTPWFNSSPNRPSWGNLNPEDLIPTQTHTVMTYDALGGDPVGSHKIVEQITLPQYAPNKAWGYTRTLKAQVAMFGDIVHRCKAEWGPTVAIVDTSDHVPRLGDMIVTKNQNSGQLWGLIDAPDDWEHDRGHFVDFSPPHFKLALLSTDIILDLGDEIFDLAPHPDKAPVTADPRWLRYGELIRQVDGSHSAADYVIWFDGEVYNLTEGDPPTGGTGGYRTLETLLNMKGYALRDVVADDPGASLAP